jgi:transglutaminase-like putative cysteine protease
MREKAVQELQAQGMRFNRGADDVLQQRSGDHDDLNRLFVAMVRTAGIPAWLMRVPDRGKNLFEPYFLSPQQFDAEISIVQLDGKDMFLTRVHNSVLTDYCLGTTLPCKDRGKTLIRIPKSLHQLPPNISKMSSSE